MRKTYVHVQVDSVMRQGKVIFYTCVYILLEVELELETGSIMATRVHLLAHAGFYTGFIAGGGFAEFCSIIMQYCIALPAVPQFV